MRRDHTPRDHRLRSKHPSLCNIGWRRWLQQARRIAAGQRVLHWGPCTHVLSTRQPAFSVCAQGKNRVVLPCSYFRRWRASQRERPARGRCAGKPLPARPARQSPTAPDGNEASCPFQSTLPHIVSTMCGGVCRSFDANGRISRLSRDHHLPTPDPGAEDTLGSLRGRVA